MPWIVAMTKPNSEAIAAKNLLRQGYEPYYPRCLQAKKNHPCEIPLFPRYIFIMVFGTWYPIRSTRGITRLLMGESGPQIIPADQIATLRSRENDRGLIQLLPKSSFSSGDKVKASSGPFEGQLMVYEEMTARERCRVLADWLGQKVRVEIDEKVLVAA
jgi:transcriptional antiterminator RfaH